MAYICPNCKKNRLSSRCAEVKVCLECGNIKDKENLLNLLKNLGFKDKTIELVSSEINEIVVKNIL
jgi:Zn-finger protein